MEYDETSGKGNATINLTLLDGQEMDSKQLNSILATIDEKIKEYEFNSIDEDSKNDIDNIDFEDDGIFIFFLRYFILCFTALVTVGLSNAVRSSSLPLRIL